MQALSFVASYPHTDTSVPTFDRFYGKAYFYSNLNKDGNGGAITSTSGGEIK